MPILHPPAPLQLENLSISCISPASYKFHGTTSAAGVPCLQASKGARLWLHFGPSTSAGRHSIIIRNHSEWCTNWSRVHIGGKRFLSFCCSDYFAFAFWKWCLQTGVHFEHLWTTYKKYNKRNKCSSKIYKPHGFNGQKGTVYILYVYIHTMPNKHALLVMAATSLLDSSESQVLERRATACNQGVTIWLAWPAKLFQQESIDSRCGLCQSCYQLIPGDQSTLFVAAWPKSRLHAEDEGIGRTWRHSVPMKPSWTRPLASPQVSHWPSEPKAKWA